MSLFATKLVVDFSSSKFSNVSGFKSAKVTSPTGAKKITFDPDDLESVISREETLDGFKKQMEAKGKIVLDLKTLDELLEDRSLIPGRWDNDYVYFPNTDVKDYDGDPIVFSLYYTCCGGGWKWKSEPVKRGLYGKKIAVIDKKNLREVK